MKNPSPSELNVTPEPTLTEPVVVEPDTFTFCKKVALVFVLMFSVPIPVTVEIPAPNVTVRLSPKLTVAAVPTAVPLS